MSKNILPNLSVNELDSEQRFQYFIDEAIQQQQIWILTDQQGCVMLNTDDEDCVPVWPSEDSAQNWATADWQHCKAEPVALKVWQHRWTLGLEEDQFHVVVFPVEQQEGTVIHPQDLDAELRKKIKANNKAK
ncbi:MAG: hypothetical protein OFPII_12720 [Osedax symbiont Rs1]|nr:MAG: hypothetical protein OFPII_12720 [Osedax symbiont Rs1]